MNKSQHDNVKENHEIKVDTIYDIAPTRESNSSSKTQLTKPNAKKQAASAFDNIDTEKFWKKIKGVYFQPKSLPELIEGLENSHILF